MERNSYISAGTYGGRKDVFLRIHKNGLKVLRNTSFSGVKVSAKEKRIQELQRSIDKLESGDATANNPTLLKARLKEEKERLEAKKNCVSRHNKKGRSYNGQMSPQTKRHVQRLLSNWVESLQVVSDKDGQITGHRQLTFATFTLCAEQMHDDKKLKREFTEKIIKWARRTKNVENYFWRAEPQRNGNIHFHVVFDNYINWYEMRERWNEAVMQPLGYIEQFQKNARRKYMDESGAVHFKYDKQQFTRYGTDYDTQKARFEKAQAENWTNPNSTDIREVYNVKNFMGYLCKYMIKTDVVRTVEAQAKAESINLDRDQLKRVVAKIEEQEPEAFRKIEGNIWGSSKAIKELETCDVPLDDDIQQYLDAMIETKHARCKQFDYATVISMDVQQTLKAMPMVYEYWKYINFKNYYRLYIHTEPPERPLSHQNTLYFSKRYVQYEKEYNAFLEKRAFRRKHRRRIDKAHLQLIEKGVDLCYGEFVEEFTKICTESPSLMPKNILQYV